MIKDSIENYYTKRNVSDFIVKNKTGGFTDEQISAVKTVTARTTWKRERLSIYGRAKKIAQAVLSRS